MPLQIIGLTGGIACGKSAFSKVAASTGLRVIDLDEIARRVVAPRLPAHAAITAAFGPAALLPDGTLDRAKVGEMAFADGSKRRALNAATHRPILTQLLAELAAALAAGERAVLIDAPLLFETGLHWLCAHVIVISVTDETQLARLRGRDGFSDEEARRRVASQMPLALKVQKADTVVKNEGDVAALRKSAEAALRAAGAVAAPGGNGGLARWPCTRSWIVSVLLWVVLAILRVAGVRPLPRAAL